MALTGFAGATIGSGLGSGLPVRAARRAAALTLRFTGSMSSMIEWPDLDLPLDRSFQDIAFAFQGAALWNRTLHMDLRRSRRKANR